MTSDKAELLKKLSALNPAMLDSFLLNKGFYIANRDDNKGKKPLFWHSKFTSIILVYTNLKAHKLEF